MGVVGSTDVLGPGSRVKRIITTKTLGSYRWLKTLGSYEQTSVVSGWKDLRPTPLFTIVRPPPSCRGGRTSDPLLRLYHSGPTSFGEGPKGRSYRVGDIPVVHGSP